MEHTRHSRRMPTTVTTCAIRSRTRSSTFHHRQAATPTEMLTPAPRVYRVRRKAGMRLRKAKASRRLSTVRGSALGLLPRLSCKGPVLNVTCFSHSLRYLLQARSIHNDNTCSLNLNQTVHLELPQRTSNHLSHGSHSCCHLLLRESTFFG